MRRGENLSAVLDRIHDEWWRWPGYVGLFAVQLFLPLVLGTWWGLIPGAVGCVAFIVRTALEDRTLRRELPGYADYAQQVRYPLLPGVW